MPLTVHRAKIDRRNVDDRHLSPEMRATTADEEPHIELPEGFRDEITEMEFLSRSGVLKITATDDISGDEEDIIVPKRAVVWMERDAADHRP